MIRRVSFAPSIFGPVLFGTFLLVAPLMLPSPAFGDDHAGHGSGEKSNDSAASNTVSQRNWVTAITKLGDDQFLAATSSGLLLQPSQVMKFSAQDPANLTSHYDHPVAVWDVAVASDGRRTVSVDYRGNLIEFASESEGSRTHQGAFDQWCHAVLVSPDNQYAIAGNESGKLMFWDFGQSKVTKTIQLGDQSITDLAISPNQKQIAASDGSGRVHLVSWPQLETVGKIKCSDEPAWAIAFDDDGKLFVGCGDYKLYRTEAKDDAKARAIGAGDDWLTSISIGPSGVIAVGQPNGKVLFFRTEGNDQSATTTLEAPSGVWSLLWNGPAELLVGTRQHGVQSVSQSWNWASGD